MQVSVERPTKLKRRLTVTLPAEEYSTAIDKRLQKLSKTAKVKGFRTGNVPVSHIKQLYGDSVRQEALSDLIQSSLYLALSQEKLRPAGVPSIEPTKIELGQPLEYIATFDVYPEIESVNFAGGEIEKQTSSIEDADVDRVIERLSEQHTTWIEVDRPAREKDQVIVDFRGSIDGKVFAGGEAHEYPVVIGSNTMIPGFEEGLIGVQKGDKKTITVTFPETYFAKEVAGKAAEFEVDVRKVSEPKLADMNADLVKKFGIASGDIGELKAEIRKNLERELERLVTAKLKAKVFDMLLEQNALEVPEAMIDQEAKRIHDEAHPHHGEQAHNHGPEEMAEFNIAAKRNVILGLLVSEFVKQNKLTPDAARVQEHIAKLSSAYENPAEVVKWYTQDKRRFAEVEMLILEEQVIEKLLEKLTIKEKALSYADLVRGA